MKDSVFAIDKYDLSIITYADDIIQVVKAHIHEENDLCNPTILENVFNETSDKIYEINEYDIVTKLASSNFTLDNPNFTFWRSFTRMVMHIIDYISWNMFGRKEL